MKPFACMKLTGTQNSPYMVSSSVLYTKRLAVFHTFVLCGRRVAYVSVCSNTKVTVFCIGVPDVAIS